MTKIRIPLLSFGAKGGLGKALSFRRSHKETIAEKKPIVVDVESGYQLSWRHMYQKCTALWHLLSATEKQEWESAARRKHMTGYAWFISQCLKPNPGIYLPLQGGTMLGNIDMAKHRLLKLPLPTDDQEAATKKYHDDNLPIPGYTEGARVQNLANVWISNNTYTICPFNDEEYDTDNIHDNVVFNSRLTAKTAGKYVIAAHVYWDSNATGLRYIHCYLNGLVISAAVVDSPIVASPFIQSFADVRHLYLNDYIELRVYQNSGVGLNILYAPEFSPIFMMQRIG